MTQVIFLAVVAVLALIASLLYAEYMRRQRRASLPDDLPVLEQLSDASRSAPSVSRETHAVAEWLTAVAFEQTGCVIAVNGPAHRRIHEAAQTAVRELEHQTEAMVSLADLVNGEAGSCDLEVRLTRDVIDLLVRS